MARFRFKGIDEYELKLSQMASGSKEIAGKAIYAAANIVADAVREGIEALPEVDYRKHGTSDDKLTGITSAQKQGLLDGFGITPMDKDSNGFYNVKLGFDGYNAVKTQQYPQGQPNQLIARSVNSGTSFRTKIPFVDKAVKASRNEALDAMQDVLDEEFDKIWK